MLHPGNNIHPIQSAESLVRGQIEANKLAFEIILEDDAFFELLSSFMFKQYKYLIKAGFKEQEAISILKVQKNF